MIPGVSRNGMPASVRIPFGEMLTGLVPSIKVSANTLHKMSACLCFWKHTPIFFPHFSAVIPGGYFPNNHGKKEEKKTSEQICKAYISLLHMKYTRFTKYT
jgi:hypothetical protein